jgi:hypothetical protein
MWQAEGTIKKFDRKNGSLQESVVPNISGQSKAK